MNVYLDNAASTPLDAEVFEKMRPYLEAYYGNPSSTHAYGRKLRAEIEQARRTIAQLIGAKPFEIYFTSGGTEADNLALYGLTQAYPVSQIISTRTEHHAVSHPLELIAKQKSIPLYYLSLDEKGNIDLAELEQQLAQHPKSLVALMHANNEIGTIYPIDEIAALCQKYEAWFHSDTVQTMGHVMFDVSQTPIHFLTASAHKFNGPKGVGFLYVRKGIQMPALIHGGGQERDLRSGTENVAAIVGMAFALEKAYAKLAYKRTHLLKLKNRLYEGLSAAVPGVQVNGETDFEKALPSVLNLSFTHTEEDLMLIFHLDLEGIAASGGSACSAGALEGSEVLRAIGRNASDAKNSVRFSFGIQNTEAEIDHTVERLKHILNIPVS